MKKLLSFLSFTAAFSCSFAQNTSNYASVDATVEKLGPLPALNIATIADTITEAFSSKEEQARAIYYWIANNIAIDPKATKQNDRKNTLPEKVIELRKATPLGFSLLFQEMCSDVKIRCISVDGFVKRTAEEINESIDEPNSSWNVVQLGQSPETWFFVDACRASGVLDKKFTVFTKQFTSEYFFADKKLFNLASYPDNVAWQLGGGPKSIKEYYALPSFGDYSFASGLSKPEPMTGYIKANLKNPIVFKIRVTTPIKEITVVRGDARKQLPPEKIDYNDNGGVLVFDYKFKKEETAPFRILGDGKILMEYMIEVNE